MSQEDGSDRRRENAITPKRVDSRPARNASSRRPRSIGPKPGDLTNVDELFDYFFASDGKRVPIPQKTWKVIEASLGTYSPPVDVAKRVGDLIARDHLLRVPPRVMIALESACSPQQLRFELTRILQYGLMRHPLFAAIADRGHPWDASVDSTMTRLSLAVRDISAHDLGIKADKVPPPDREKLRWNALLVTALLFTSARELPVEVLVGLLEEHLWQPAVKQSGSPPVRAAIADAMNAEALVAVAGVFRTRSQLAEINAAEARASAAAAERSATFSHDRAMTAESALAERNTELERTQTTIAALRNDVAVMDERISSERRDREIDKGHHADDYEVLRTRVARTLGKQVDLLSDGLHALQHNTYDVTEEYLERAIESLSKEYKQLQADTGEE